MRTGCAMVSALVLAGLAFTQDAGAQGAPSAGRVRVVELTTGRAVIVGQLVRRSSDSILIIADTVVVWNGTDKVIIQGSEQMFILGEQHRLEHSAGIRGRTLNGMGIGLLVGTAGGALLGAATYRAPDCGPEAIICLDFGRGFSATVAAIMGGGTGILLGATFGASAKYELWRPLAERGARVAIAPTAKGGVQLRGAMAF